MNDAANTEALLARWLAGELSEAELEQVRQREDFADLQQIVEGMEGLALPGFDEKASLARLRERRPEPAGSPKTETKGQPAKAGGYIVPFRRIFAIAATVAALLAVGWWFFAEGAKTYDNTFTTTTGEQLEFKLPDGSTVNLNAASTLEYASADWPAERRLHLTGEAHFRVRKGSTFSVETAQGTVTVVGTIFNVFARGEELSVKCTHGKVQVTSPHEQKTLIKAGEQVSVINGELQKRQGIDFTPKWFRGESVFKTTALPKVFDELERQYGIVVLHGDLNERSFSGKFGHDDLDGAIKRICGPMKLNCSLNSDTLRVQ